MSAIPQLRQAILTALYGDTALHGDTALYMDTALLVWGTPAVHEVLYALPTRPVRRQFPPF